MTLDLEKNSVILNPSLISNMDHVYSTPGP